MPQRIRAKKWHRRVVVRKTDEGEEAGAKLSVYAAKQKTRGIGWLHADDFGPSLVLFGLQQQRALLVVDGLEQDKPAFGGDRLS